MMIKPFHVKEVISEDGRRMAEYVFRRRIEKEDGKIQWQEISSRFELEDGEDAEVAVMEVLAQRGLI